MIEEAAVQRAKVPISVLVVEDEESTRKLCADVAESCGMKAVVAGSVEEALRICNASHRLRKKFASSWTSTPRFLSSPATPASCSRC